MVAKHGNGVVRLDIDTTGMAVGTYAVTITGRVLTQTVTFKVKNPNFGSSTCSTAGVVLAGALSAAVGAWSGQLVEAVVERQRPVHRQGRDGADE